MVLWAIILSVLRDMLEEEWKEGWKETLVRLRPNVELLTGQKYVLHGRKTNLEQEIQ